MGLRLFVHKQLLSDHTLNAICLAGPGSKQATLHAHTARETGHISRLIAVLHPRTGKVMKARPRVLLPGADCDSRGEAHSCEAGLLDVAPTIWCLSLFAMA